MHVPSLARLCSCSILVPSRFLGVWGYIEIWSCQIYHKIFLPDFQLFISRGGGRYIEFWSCQICHKNFFAKFQFFPFLVRVSIFWSSQFCHKNFCHFFAFCTTLLHGLLGQSSEVEHNAKMSISFVGDLVAIF